MAGRILTGALAIIKRGNQVIGFMKDIRVNENFNRTPVRGIGAYYPREVPTVTGEGRLTASFVLIDLVETGVPDAIRRDTNQVQLFIDNLLLQEDGLNIEIFKKEKTGVDANGFPTSENKAIASIRNLFITSDSLELSDGGLGGRNQEFMYTQPMLENQ